MPHNRASGLPSYPTSLAGALLGAREAVMAPIRPHLRLANVTEQQWRVLRVLDEAEALDGRGIADQALLYAPTVTRILKDLVERGLVERRKDPEDGRRLIISITPAGRQLVVDTVGNTKLLLDAYIDAFGSERLEAFKAESFALAEALAQFRPSE